MRTILGVVAAAWLVAGPALAGGVPKDGLTAKDVADWLKHQHLDAAADAVGKKDAPANVIRVAGAEPFAIYLYDCRKDRCASMQYAASVAAPGMTTARVNAWNRQSRYVRAYLDTSGRLYGEYDLDIAPGLNQAALDHSLKRWLSASARFRLFASLP